MSHSNIFSFILSLSFSLFLNVLQGGFLDNMISNANNSSSSIFMDGNNPAQAPPLMLDPAPQPMDFFDSEYQVSSATTPQPQSSYIVRDERPATAVVAVPSPSQLMLLNGMQQQSAADGAGRDDDGGVAAAATAASSPFLTRSRQQQPPQQLSLKQTSASSSLELESPLVSVKKIQDQESEFDKMKKALLTDLDLSPGSPERGQSQQPGLLSLEDCSRRPSREYLLDDLPREHGLLGEEKRQSSQDSGSEKRPRSKDTLVSIFGGSEGGGGGSGERQEEAGEGDDDDDNEYRESFSSLQMLNSQHTDNNATNNNIHDNPNCYQDINNIINPHARNIVDSSSTTSTSSTTTTTTTSRYQKSSKQLEQPRYCVSPEQQKNGRSPPERSRGDGGTLGPTSTSSGLTYDHFASANSCSTAGVGGKNVHQDGLVEVEEGMKQQRHQQQGDLLRDLIAGGDGGIMSSSRKQIGGGSSGLGNEKESMRDCYYYYDSSSSVGSGKRGGKLVWTGFEFRCDLKREREYYN